jgi:lipopolysaccharide transport system ATP-binding protein
LFVDEVLSVGDLPFQRKCMEFAKGLQQGNATILFVSHNMFSIKTMCNRVIYLRKGEVIFDGPTDEGIELYEQDCRLSALSWAGKQPHEWPVRITECDLFDEGGARKSVFDYGEPIRLRLRYEVRDSVESPNFIVALVRSDGVACCNFSTETDGILVDRISGSGMIELRTTPLKLVAGSYAVHLLIRKKGFQELLGAQVGITFHVRHDLFDEHFGVFHESGAWVWEDEKNRLLVDNLIRNGSVDQARHVP